MRHVYRPGIRGMGFSLLDMRYELRRFTWGICLMFCFSSVVLCPPYSGDDFLVEHLGWDEDALLGLFSIGVDYYFLLSMFPLLLMFFFFIWPPGGCSLKVDAWLHPLTFPCYLNPGLAATPLTTDERYELAIGTMIL